jgi:hypothetical protein
VGFYLRGHLFGVLNVSACLRVIEHLLEPPPDLSLADAERVRVSQDVDASSLAQW